MVARIHPSQARREIDRHHKWAFGHDPRDPDATPESPWIYANIEYFDVSDPDQRALLTGGPDTGHTCYQCGSGTYHVAASRPAAWVLTQAGVEILGEDPNFEALEGIDIVIWGCPTCGHKVQWRSDQMPQFKEAQ